MMNDKAPFQISRRSLLQKGIAGTVALTFLPLDGIAKSFAQGTEKNGKVAAATNSTTLPFLKRGVPQFQVKVLSDKAPLHFAAQQIAQIVPQLAGKELPPSTSAWTLKIDIANEVLAKQKLSRERLGDDGYLIVKDGDGFFDYWLHRSRCFVWNFRAIGKCYRFRLGASFDRLYAACASAGCGSQIVIASHE